MQPDEPGPRNSPTLIVVVLLSLAIVLLLIVRYGPSPAPEDRKPIGLETKTGQVRVEKDHIVVYVVGAVHSPGVYTLPLGSRAVDAVKAAGGLTDKANQFGVNLAARVHDEQMVRVPAIGEKIPTDTPTPDEDSDETFTPAPEASSEPPAPGLTPPAPVKKSQASATPAADGSPESSAAPVIKDQVSLNRAGLKELMGVPGVDDKMAKAIVAYRTGPPPHAFASFEDLEKITGLKRRELKPMLPYLKL